jgi:hypothetical protein
MLNVLISLLGETYARLKENQALLVNYITLKYITDIDIDYSFKLD